MNLQEFEYKKAMSTDIETLKELVSRESNSIYMPERYIPTDKVTDIDIEVFLETECQLIEDYKRYIIDFSFHVLKERIKNLFLNPYSNIAHYYFDSLLDHFFTVCNFGLYKEEDLKPLEQIFYEENIYLFEYKGKQYLLKHKPFYVDDLLDKANVYFGEEYDEIKNKVLEKLIDYFKTHTTN